jgi:hypothetical protein
MGLVRVSGGDLLDFGLDVDGGDAGGTAGGGGRDPELDLEVGGRVATRICASAS